ncbi:MAG: flagellin [Chloroflexi bacterium]|nr:flagellin [Chloroflexota bacterium]
MSSTVINTNVSALIAQRNLAASGVMLSKSTERLSSGLRINRAGDDAAGLAISEKLEAQIRGTRQASRNGQDGISMIQTAEGALIEVHSMLQRMRELSVQASNGTLSATDRSSINTEVQALKTEIDAISTRTKFNGQNLLTGALATSVDATSELKDNTALAVVLADLFTVSTVEVTAAAAGTTYTLSAGTGANQLTMTATVGGSVVAQTLTLADMTGANASQLLNWDKLGVKVTVVTGAANANNTAVNLRSSFVAAANDTVITAAGSSSATYQIGADNGQTMTVAFAQVDTTAMSLTTSLTNFNASQSVANAQALISAVDTAIDYVNSKRGSLGASQNRLEHTIANLAVTADNLAASQSLIRDVDMAAEMVQYTKTQILQQAGMAILSQANSAPQSVLSLLR